MEGVGGKPAWASVYSLDYSIRLSLNLSQMDASLLIFHFPFNMNNRAPISFILEGLATVLAGVASFWIIQDFPDTAKFLTEAERTVVIRRLQEDDQFSAAGEKLKMKYIWKSLTDWKTWLGSKASHLMISV
jgi:hypothetical protein